MSTNPTPDPMVLLGGSGLGPWAWTAVSTRLTQSGIPVLLPDLTGLPATGHGLTGWRNHVLGEVSDLERYTLVAHSFAGYLAAALVEEEPSRIGRLILIDAVLPEPEQSFFDSIGADAASFMTSLAVDDPSGHGPVVPWFNAEQLDGLYPGHGMSPQTVALVQALAAPQPLSTYRSAPTRQSLHASSVPTTYIRCRHTPPPLDTDALPPGWTIVAIEAGHWPMFTLPDELTAILTRVSTS
ncbi:alpha/beta fold hydrolase [Ornithinimicrobium panacihumi]|uniref:alpha/beta fold hydrolase n=1 Tax=Ornithinimicrobium panacihumi TaxID=2008449 RepID=UPI003F8AC8C0